MEKRVSKWLEMQSQRQRFKKKFGGGPPDPPSNEWGVPPPLILSPRSRLVPLAPSLRLQVPPVYNPSGSIIAKRSLSARMVWYPIFSSGEGVAIKVAMENGKKHHRKAPQRHIYNTGEAEKYYQKRRPVTGFKHIRLLHGNIPALASKIVTAFWKKEKVTV